MGITRAFKPVACGLALALSLHFAFAAASATGKEDESLLSNPLESLSLDELDDELQVRVPSTHCTRLD